MNKHFAFFLIIFAFVFATLACSLTFNLGNSGDDKILLVQADEGWTDTEIFVEAGEHLIITYLSGKWSSWPGEEYDAIGSGGDPRCRCNVVEGISHTALIGRIGNHEPFLIGERYEHTIGETGTLYLGINDVDLYDNSGYLQVMIELDK